MNDSSEILFTEFDKYVKYNFDNNITVNYDEILRFVKKLDLKVYSYMVLMVI